MLRHRTRVIITAWRSQVSTRTSSPLSPQQQTHNVRLRFSRKLRRLLRAACEFSRSRVLAPPIHACASWTSSIQVAEVFGLQNATSQKTSSFGIRLEFRDDCNFCMNGNLLLRTNVLRILNALKQVLAVWQTRMASCRKLMSTMPRTPGNVEFGAQ